MQNGIITKIKDGSSTFERMAKLYSMGGEAETQGDLGWIATGAVVPVLEAEQNRHKKGDMFKVWTLSRSSYYPQDRRTRNRWMDLR